MNINISRNNHYKSQLISDRELLEIFPEAKDIIPYKISEWELEKQKVVDQIKDVLIFSNTTLSDDFGRWFIREWVKINLGQELIFIKRHIKRLTRLMTILNFPNKNETDWHDKLISALEVPIVEIVGTETELRIRGNRLFGLCPLHRERSPSFVIYSETNTFYCFGCNQGGNAITFIKLKHGFNFKEAIKYLVGD